MSADDLLSGSTTSKGPQLGARLRVVHPTSLCWAQSLPLRSIIIGRIETGDVTVALTHGTVSRRHFELHWDEVTGRHTGRDLGSHNGSRLDGRDIGHATVAIPDGALLQLGDVCLMYERLTAETAQTPMSPLDEPILGDSPPMIVLRTAMRQAASESTPVVLYGPAATGKKHIAGQLHQLSARRGPLVTLDCSAVSPASLESRLFGHIRGAFAGATRDQPGLFATAAGGTLLLDDIGELPLALQPKLLHALQAGEVCPIGGTEAFELNVRLITTTRVNLRLRVDAGGFDADLYDCLAQPLIQVPALRERRGDIMAWLQRLHATWFDRQPEHTHETLTLSTEAAETVLLHDWSRNLRDVERLVDELVTAPHLRRPIARAQLPSWLRNSDLMSSDGQITAVVEVPPEPRPDPTREELAAAYQRFDGNVRAMAQHFCRDRHQINRWLELHELSIPLIGQD